MKNIRKLDKNEQTSTDTTAYLLPYNKQKIFNCSYDKSPLKFTSISKDNSSTDSTPKMTKADIIHNVNIKILFLYSDKIV